MSVPPELKFVNTFLQRAQELEMREPIVSYYCKYYACKLAIDSNVTSKEGQAFLVNLMDKLETEKQHLSTHEAITNQVVGYAHVENFALKIFTNADNEDRAGKATTKTAKTFLAASIFMELLNIFGDLDLETSQKIKYAKFKAADIVKALKEGRTPHPGPPTETIEPEKDIVTSKDMTTLKDTTPTKDAAPVIFQTPDPVLLPSAPIAHPITTIEHATETEYDEHTVMTIQKAQKHAKFAQSALMYDDVSTAIDNLQKALDLLKPLEK